MLTVNLAEMGTAKQSSSYQGFNAAKALDGNRNQNWFGYSCGHTAVNQAKAWWRLNIGQRVNIYNIVIYYRENSKYKMCVTRSTIVSLFLPVINKMNCVYKRFDEIIKIKGGILVL